MTTTLITQNIKLSTIRTPAPEYVIVHDGPPSDNRAKDYYVTYKDYIKNKFIYPLISGHYHAFNLLATPFTTPFLNR